ncbi:MAG: GGDEF domain-containing protein [Azonexus sp.]|jgi:diguanylate cyclase|nr:GGDEF domain-containing protein [Azonexus sp.]
MNTSNKPFEIARETLRQLVARRVPPTPDNYLALYHQIAGTAPQSEAFPGKWLRSLNSGLPRSSPDQLRLARQLEEAVKDADWDGYKAHLLEFITALAETQKLQWAELIGDLFKRLETRHHGLTAARKREALEHVLSGSGSNPETLYNRLTGLLRAWGQGREDEAAAEEEEQTPAASAAPPPSAAARDNLLPQLRQLFAFTLETAIATQLVESPELSSAAKALANDIRSARSNLQLEDFLARLKRFAFKLELLAEDRAELRASLLGLLRLLVDNMTELVVDDRWLHGQIEVVRDLIGKPLSQRTIDEAEQRLKEVLFKQSQLKTSLLDARDAIKQMLAGFVDHLADFADATSDYHDKIDACAARISAAEDITALENVLDDVMRETRIIQLNALRSRDELRATQRRVEESEARIRQLEKELEATSDLVRYDQLSGVLNRRGLEEMFTKEAARAARRQAPLCVALLDIDNFKQLNDAMGHDAGDQALIHLARLCRDTMRPQDTVARYGGEEFVILLPDTRLADGATALRRLQRELTKKFFMHNNDKVLITFSAGVTELTAADDQASAVKRADGAMYQAKEAGKNRVVSV